MERWLSRMLMEHGAAAPGQSLISTIKIAVLPIAKVFTMCFLGFLMASKYVKILPASGRKLLNGVSLCLCLFLVFSFFNSCLSQFCCFVFLLMQLVFTLLLPCFIFSQLGQAITIRKMLEWYVYLLSKLCIY